MKNSTFYSAAAETSTHEVLAAAANHLSAQSVLLQIAADGPAADSCLPAGACVQVSLW